MSNYQRYAERAIEFLEERIYSKEVIFNIKNAPSYKDYLRKGSYIGNEAKYTVMEIIIRLIKNIKGVKEVHEEDIEIGDFITIPISIDDTYYNIVFPNTIGYNTFFLHNIQFLNASNLKNFIINTDLVMKKIYGGENLLNKEKVYNLLELETQIRESLEDLGEGIFI